MSTVSDGVADSSLDPGPAAITVHGTDPEVVARPVPEAGDGVPSGRTAAGDAHPDAISARPRLLLVLVPADGRAAVCSGCDPRQRHLAVAGGGGNVARGTERTGPDRFRRRDADFGGGVTRRLARRHAPQGPHLEGVRPAVGEAGDRIADHGRHGVILELGLSQSPSSAHSDPIAAFAGTRSRRRPRRWPRTASLPRCPPSPPAPSAGRGCCRGGSPRGWTAKGGVIGALIELKQRDSDVGGGGGGRRRGEAWEQGDPAAVRRPKHPLRCHWSQGPGPTAEFPAPCTADSPRPSRVAPTTPRLWPITCRRRSRRYRSFARFRGWPWAWRWPRWTSLLLFRLVVRLVGLGGRSRLARGTCRS